MLGGQVLGELTQVEAIAPTRVRAEVPLVDEVGEELADEWVAVVHGVTWS
jgi:hypothetical protein